MAAASIDGHDHGAADSAAMRYDVDDLVLSYAHTHVFPLLELMVGDEVDEAGWIYRPVVARVPSRSTALEPGPGYVVHDTAQRRVVLEFLAMRVWRFADDGELGIEGQVLVAARAPDDTASRIREQT